MINKLSSIKKPLRLSLVSILFLSAFAILMVSNLIFNYMQGALQIISYALLLITICCCYEAYFKIRRNSGYIYIALICFLLLLPAVIQLGSSMLARRPARVGSVMRRVSNTAISQCEIKDSIEVEVKEFYLPLIELFLLLAVLRFSNNDYEDKDEKDTLDSPSSPDDCA